MTIEHDYFRPREAPASLLYDAFQEEAKHRKGRDVDEWIRLELEAVHRAAVTYAEQHGLHAPTMEQVAAAERYARACGLWIQVGSCALTEDERHQQHLAKSPPTGVLSHRLIWSCYR